MYDENSKYSGKKPYSATEERFTRIEQKIANLENNIEGLFREIQRLDEEKSDVGFH